MLHIVYTPEYDIQFNGLEKLHPFDTCKYSRAYNEVHKHFGDTLTQRTITPPYMVSDHDLERVHTNAYLKQLRQTDYLAQALEFGLLRMLPLWMIDQHLIKPMKLAVQGTIEATRAALKPQQGLGMAINLSGGYHHCSAERGEGFTIFSDMCIALAVARAEGLLGGNAQALILDFDAHQGNGHERILYDDPRVTICDIYNAQIYPNDTLAKKRIDVDVPLRAGVDDVTYLEQLNQALPLALSKGADFAIYIAGTDIYTRDALGGLAVSEDGIFARDQLVLDTLTNANIPWVMLPAGGYSQESYRMIARTIHYALETWG
jgi:histone deacetylase 11